MTDNNRCGIVRRIDCIYSVKPGREDYPIICVSWSKETDEITLTNCMDQDFVELAEYPRCDSNAQPLAPEANALSN